MNKLYCTIVIMILTIFTICLTSCSHTKTSNLPDSTSIDTKDSGKQVITDDDVIMKWGIALKGYNIVYPPATLNLTFRRYAEEGPDLNYKYQLKPDQPWIDVSNQVNAVGIGDSCDIPLTFTEPGKYWITGRIYDGEEWTGLYETFFVIVLPPQQ